MCTNELREVRPVVSLPFSISGMGTRTNFKKPHCIRLHTSSNEEQELCRRPLEVKEYSNKFLRATGWQEKEQKRYILNSNASKRLFRHRRTEVTCEDKYNSSSRVETDSYLEMPAFAPTVNHQQNRARISTSRALYLFSKILKTNKTEGSVIEYPRRNTLRNSNFNIQRIQLKQKWKQSRMKYLCRSMMKSEAKTQQVVNRQPLGSRANEQLHRPLKTRLDSICIDPWEILVDNDF